MMILHFLFKLSSPKNVGNYFHTHTPSPDVTKIQTWPTTPRNLDLISFMVSLCFFFFNLENDSGNFISLGLYFILWFCWKWVGCETGFYNHTMWIISSLEAGSSLPLCSLIQSPWSAVLAGLIMKCSPTYHAQQRAQRRQKKSIPQELLQRWIPIFNPSCI